ncbi:hypothetical protein [Terrisporobacter sp.]|uniref:hypothetical protein n=1 Tax=Terrisporobacter sp. TaxID=1965305 RepID=UPI002616897F|nr:hypothetical protein [Terrisporobacter sp.]
MIDFILILLPVVVVGIAVILFINNVKKTNEKRKAFEDEKVNQNEENAENPEENYMAIGMCFGVAIGTIFFNEESRPYGICFGMLFGMVIGMSIKKK